MRHCNCFQQQNQQADGRLDGPAEDRVLIHGLSVERYRVIYNSVLQPSVLAALSSAKNTVTLQLRTLSQLTGNTTFWKCFCPKTDRTVINQ